MSLLWVKNKGRRNIHWKFCLCGSWGIIWLFFLEMLCQQSYIQWGHKIVVIWAFQWVLNLPRAWLYEGTALLISSYSAIKKGWVHVRVKPYKFVRQKNQDNILKYIPQNKGMVFSWNTARKRNITMFSPVNISQELISISWRLYFGTNRRESKKKVVAFYKAHKSVTWQMIKVLIKHSDSITPALHNSMVYRTTKKQAESLPEKRNRHTLRVVKTSRRD